MLSTGFCRRIALGAWVFPEEQTLFGDFAGRLDPAKAVQSRVLIPMVLTDRRCILSDLLTGLASCLKRTQDNVRWHSPRLFHLMSMNLLAIRTSAAFTPRAASFLSSSCHVEELNLREIGF